MRTIKLIKNRSDLGAGTRGSDLGIDAIEIAAINKDDDYFNCYPFEDIATVNETVYDKVHNSFAKRIGCVLKVCTRLSESIKNSLKDNSFPIILSGDHSSAIGSISGIKAAYPNKRLGVVWIDAHADINSPFTSPSGNIHGMSLAATLNDDNLKHRINNVYEDTQTHWTQLKNIGVKGQKVKHEDVIYFGVRDTEETEKSVIKENQMRNYMVDEMRYRGFDTCLQEGVARLDNCDMIYISFDVDSMDCDLISKGTGTPVSKGFDQYEIIEIIKAFIETDKVECFEVVEVNPLLDKKGNVMAETAFEVLKATTEIVKSRLKFLVD